MKKFFEKNALCLLLAVSIAVQLMLSSVVYADIFRTQPLIDFVVVIDAGHGGIDNGVVANGVVESKLNLAYAKALGKRFADCGFTVVFTRTGDGGLYGLPTKGFKRRDMEKRKQIICRSSANMVISVHMNKYGDSSRSGAQVFFQQGSVDGNKLADSIQKCLNLLSGKNLSALAGDYYVTRCSNAVSVIVECGFVSNLADAEKLVTEEYKNCIVDKIFEGAMLYLYQN